ncbi:hypothetical protein BC629DRAFT_235052 [Irpex lacteus]|nr:hypothetical protein BC629DRAFT_235052 [Irpex lacteus]
MDSQAVSSTPNVRSLNSMTRRNGITLLVLQSPRPQKRPGRRVNKFDSLWFAPLTSSRDCTRISFLRGRCSPSMIMWYLASGLRTLRPGMRSLNLQHTGKVTLALCTHAVGGRRRVAMGVAAAPYQPERLSVQSICCLVILYSNDLGLYGSC